MKYWNDLDTFFSFCPLLPTSQSRKSEREKLEMPYFSFWVIGEMVGGALLSALPGSRIKSVGGSPTARPEHQG